MRGMVDKILRQYGTGMTLIRDGEETSVRGFFQPVLSRSFQNMVQLDTPLGEVGRGQYLYIGSAEAMVREGDSLRLGDREYVFCRAEPYYYCADAVYIWGLCMEKGEEDTWGFQS